MFLKPERTLDKPGIIQIEVGYAGGKVPQVMKKYVLETLAMLKL